MNENRKPFTPGQLPDDEDRCQALSRQTGKRCKLRRIQPSKFCKFHGGQNVGGPGNRKSKGNFKPGDPKPPGSGRGAEPGNTRAMSHGATTTAMSPAMQTLADSILIRYTSGAESISEPDMMAFERVAGIEAKFRLALANDETPPLMLDIIHRTLHRELKALKATREMRESSSTGTTPAEVIAAIMLKVAERKRELEGHPRIEAPRPEHAMSGPARRAAIIDVESEPAEVDIADDDGFGECDAPDPDPDVWTEEEEAGPDQDPDPEPELLDDQAPDGDEEWFPW